MRGHNICFHREIRTLSLNFPQYPLLSGALISGVTGLLHNRIMTPNIQEYLSLNKVQEELLHYLWHWLVVAAVLVKC